MKSEFYKIAPEVPHPPRELLDPLNYILSKKSIREGHVGLPPETPDRPLYMSKNVSAELEEWVQSIFDFDATVIYQLFKGKIPVHADQNRTLVWNYILDTGSDTPINTNWYNDSREQLGSVVMPLNCWNRIDTSILHDIDVCKDFRVMLSCWEYVPDQIGGIWNETSNRFIANTTMTVEDSEDDPTNSFTPQLTKD